MQWYHTALLAAFALAAALAWKIPRAPLWVLLLACSYGVSVLYTNFAPKGGWWPPPQLIGLLLDGAILVVIREAHEDDWEWQILGAIIGFMVTANMIQLFAVLTGFPTPFSRENFGIVLECLNILALAVIGGVGFVEMRRTDAGNSMADNWSRFLHRPSAHAQSKKETLTSLRKW